jgi:hypothetical protein
MAWGDEVTHPVLGVQGWPIEMALTLARAVRAGEVAVAPDALQAPSLPRGVGVFQAPEALGLPGLTLLQDFRRELPPTSHGQGAG